MKDTNQQKNRRWKREESRQLCAESHKNSSVWVASMNTPEYKKIQRETKLGEKNGMYGKTHSPETREKMRAAAQKRSQDKAWVENQKNRVWTLEQRDKHKKAMGTEEIKLLRRELRLKQIKESGAFPSFNPKACAYFDKLNLTFGWFGKHALNNGEKELLGYSIDYFVPEMNLVIEWDEEAHFRDEPTKIKDSLRQERLLTTGVKFYRVREKTKQITKIDKHIEDLSNKLEECFR